MPSQHPSQRVPNPASANSSGDSKQRRLANLSVLFSSTITSQVWLGLLLFRVFISIVLISTADVPDEWWQSTEVAYHVVHGKGELTWEWREGIRSFTYPLPFILIFKALGFIGLDNALTYWLCPKLFTALIALGIDYFTFILAERMFGSSVGKMALLLSVIHGYSGFLTTRTQSNVAEALVLLAALVYTTPICAPDSPERIVDVDNDNEDDEDDYDDLSDFSIYGYRPETYWKFLFLSGLGCSLRITFVLPILVPTAMYALQFLQGQRRKSKGKGKNGSSVSGGGGGGMGGLIKFLLLSVVIAGGWLGAIACVDRVYYGYWVLAPIKFIIFNVFEGLSALFGTHPWHWYLSQGLPAMLGGHMLLIPATIAVVRKAFSAAASSKKKGSKNDGVNDEDGDLHEALSAWREHDAVPLKHLLYMIVITVAGYSFLPHKEFRFIYPIVPLCIIVLAYGAVMSGGGTEPGAADPTAISPQPPVGNRHQQSEEGYKKVVKKRKQRRRWFWFFIFLANVVFFLIFGIMFQRGTLDAVTYVRRHTSLLSPDQQQLLEGGGALPGGERRSLHVLAGCHQTPGYSYLHRHIVSFVGTNCTVEMSADRKTRLPTEHHLFAEDPAAFVQWVYEGRLPGGEGKAEMAAHLKRIGRRHEWWGGTVPPTLPDRILIYTSARQELEESTAGPGGVGSSFLKEHGYQMEAQFYHTFHPLEDMIDYTIELWKLKGI